MKVVIPLFFLALIAQWNPVCAQSLSNEQIALNYSIEEIYSVEFPKKDKLYFSFNTKDRTKLYYSLVKCFDEGERFTAFTYEYRTVKKGSVELFHECYHENLIKFDLFFPH